MKIFRAVGLALVILFLQFLVPRLFQGLEDAIIAFFKLGQSVAEVSQQAIVSNGLSLPVLPH